MPDTLPTPETAPLLDAFRALLGSSGVLEAPADIAPHLQDWRGLYQGQAMAVLRPASTAEVSACVKLCAEQGIAIIPQGGNTSMVGGATPEARPRQVVLSL
eukprot:gene16784-20522_t